MAIKVKGALGDIFVSDTVMARMAGSIATQCYGVVGMVAKNKRDGLVNLLKPNYMTKGITVSAQNGGVVIEMHIMVEFGVNISVLCDNITDSVKYKLQKATGLQINDVKVSVDAIRVDE